MEKEYAQLRIHQETKDKFEELLIKHMAEVGKRVSMIDYMVIVADKWDIK